MAYDERLAQRIRDHIEGVLGQTERAMFGGLGFMIDGNLAVAAASRGSLMVRVAPDDGETWIDGEHVNPMEMRGKEMRGWLLVDPGAVASDEELQRWVDRGVAYVRTLPPKS